MFSEEISVMNKGGWTMDRQLDDEGEMSTEKRAGGVWCVIWRTIMMGNSSPLEGDCGGNGITVGLGLDYLPRYVYMYVCR